MPPKIQPVVEGADRQEPIDKVPDNPAFEDTHTVITEALKAVEAKTGTPKADEAPPKAPDALPPAEKIEKVEEQKGPTSKGWAAILVREKKLQEERARFDNETKARLHELNQTKVGLEALQTENTALRSSFKKDPFGTLKKEFGLSFNDLAQLALEDDPQVVEPKAPAGDPIVQKLLEKIEGLEKTLNGQTVQRELESYRGDIKRAVIGGGPHEILTTMPNLENEVLQLAGQYYQRTGERLSADKACGILAKYWEQHLQSLSSHAAARRVLGLPDPTDAANGKPARPKGPTKTLTNRQLASPPSGDNKLPDNLSDEQELRLAAKLIPDDAWSRMD